MRRPSATSLVFILVLAVTAQFAGATCDTAYVSHRGSTWTVFPTGIDDADNLACAFDEAVAAGSGSVVRMVAAEYFLSRPIAVLYEGDLRWRGAGMERTIIHAGREELLFPLLVDDVYFPEPGLASVFVFHQDADGWAPPGKSRLTSRLNFRGFTIRLHGLSEAWYDDFGTRSQSRSIIDVTGRIDGLRNFEASSVDLVVSELRFEGEPCDPEVCGFIDWTAYSALAVWGEKVDGADLEETSDGPYSKPIVADTAVHRCVFKRIAFAAGHFGPENSTIRIWGSRFRDVGNAYFLQDADGGSVRLWNNRINSSYWGVFTAHGAAASPDFGGDPVPELFPSAATKLQIVGNTFQCSGQVAECIAIDDYTVTEVPEDVVLLEADVTRNLMKLADGASAAVSSYTSRGISIVKNTIKGDGVNGLYAFGSEGWNIHGNRITLASGEPLWLTPTATGFKIKNNSLRGSGEAAVLVEGDEHRIFTNDVSRFHPVAAHYWLTPSSEHNRLKVGPTDTVLDDGTDNIVEIQP